MPKQPSIKLEKMWTQILMLGHSSILLHSAIVLILLYLLLLPKYPKILIFTP